MSSVEPSRAKDSDDWRPIETYDPRRDGLALLYYPTLTGRNALPEMWCVGRNDSPRQATHWQPLARPRT